VCPGLIVHQRNAIEDPKEDAFSAVMYPIGRYGSPEDVGHISRGRVCH
jgi:hypothetical protein